MKKLLLIATALCLSGCSGGGGTSAEVTNSRLVPFTTAQGQPTQMVLVDWKNTGSTPIRVVKADIVAYDASGAELASGTKDYTIYAASNSQSGIVAGETYAEPSGEGFVLVSTPGAGGAATKVDVKITSAKEESIF